MKVFEVRNYRRFLIAAIIGIITPKKIGTKIIIGNSESSEEEGELEPLSKNPIRNKINKTTPINNKNTPIRIRVVLSNLNQQPVNETNNGVFPCL